MSKSDNIKAFIKDHKTDIEIGGGIVAGIIGAVSTIFATIKVMEDLKEQEDILNDESEELSEEESKELAKTTHIHTALNIAKHSAIPVISEVVSITLILIAHNSDKKAKAEALALAVKATAIAVSIKAAFDEYRSRVVNEFGSQVDYDIYMGRQVKEVEVEEVNPKTGKTKKVKKKEATQNPINYDIYSYEWGPWTSTEYTKDPHRNIFFLDNVVDSIMDPVRGPLHNHGYYLAVDLLEHLGRDITVGMYQTETNFIPTDIGWVSKDVLDALPESWEWKGRVYFKADYTSVIDLGITESRRRQNEYDTFHGNTDDVYKLRLNCYPITPILEFAHTYFKKGQKEAIDLDRKTLKEFDHVRYFDI